MVKHTQTIFRQQPRNCLRVFGDFVGLALKGLNLLIKLELSRKLFLRENSLLPYGTVFFLVSFHCTTSGPSTDKVSVRILNMFLSTISKIVNINYIYLVVG